MSANKDIAINVRQLPNGIAMDIGKKKYLYFTPEQFIGGMLLHFGCNEMEYIDRDELDNLVTTIRTWPEHGDLYMAMGELQKQCTSLQKKLALCQAEKSVYKRKCEELSKEMKKLKNKRSERFSVRG